MCRLYGSLESACLARLWRPYYFRLNCRAIFRLERNGVIVRIVYAIDVWHDDHWDTDGMPLLLACLLSHDRCVGLCCCSKMIIAVDSGTEYDIATLFRYRPTSVHVVWYYMTESNARYEGKLRCLVKAAYWCINALLRAISVLYLLPLWKFVAFFFFLLLLFGLFNSS